MSLDLLEACAWVTKGRTVPLTETGNTGATTATWGERHELRFCEAVFGARVRRECVHVV